MIKRTILLAIEIEGDHSLVDSITPLVRRNAEAALDQPMVRIGTKNVRTRVYFATDLEPEDEITPNPNGECA